MIFKQFEHIVSPKRMERYIIAAGKRKRKSMQIYNANLNLAKEVFVVLSFFEVALRNAIDQCLTPTLGENWLRDSVLTGGRFDQKQSEHMCKVIRKRYDSLMKEGEYTHAKLLSSLEFGIWKYMFADYQYRVTGQKLLAVFPLKPKSSAAKQYDHNYFFNELNSINTLRNRIAHHEPICFSHKTRLIDTSYIKAQYARVLVLFQMMGIDSKALLKGMDHVQDECKEMEKLM